MNLAPLTGRDNRMVAFTLMEVIIAIVLLTLSFGAIVSGYIYSTNKAEWTAHSLAAQSLASQAVESAKAANWDPRTATDDLPPTNYIQRNILDIPMKGTPVEVSTSVTVKEVSTDPPLRQIQADCVWRFIKRGWFTNTVITLRGPNQ